MTIPETPVIRPISRGALDAPAFAGYDDVTYFSRHCEERSDEAIHLSPC